MIRSQTTRIVGFEAVALPVISEVVCCFDDKVTVAIFIFRCLVFS